MQIQDQFPPLGNSIYLNTPTSCLLARDVWQWRKNHDEQFFQQGYRFRDQFEGFFMGVKQTLADFFHADSRFTFLVPNFSFGFNTLLQGISASERFLLLQDDYPAVNYPVERNGFACAYVQVSDSLEDDILKKIEEHQPTAFVFSLVQYISGIKLHLPFIKYLKEQYPALLLIADGTQFCGTTAFDFKSSGLDVLAASGYKWLMGGYGNGFLIFNEAIKDRLFLTAKAHPTPSQSFLKEKSFYTLSFEPGHQDTLTFGTLQQSINLLTKWGIRHIEDHIRNLSNKAKAAFSARGLLEDKVMNRNDHSSIFNLAIDDATYQRLLAANIICVPRGSGVRVGFHFFNTEDDLTRLLAVLDAIEQI